MFGKLASGASQAGNLLKMQQQQQKLQKLMATIAVTGNSKNSKVSLTLNGNQEIVDLKIDMSLINFVYDNSTSKGNQDTTIAKFVMEAYADAQKQVQPAMMKKMQESGDINDIMSMLGSGQQ